MAPRESSRPSRGQRPRDRQRNGQSAKKTGNKKKKSQGSRRPPSGSDESRGEDRGESRGESRGEGSSKSLSAGALADLNKEHIRQKRRAERAKRANRDEYRDRDRNLERPRKGPKDKKRRVVSGAIMEEGRASGLRGGNNRWSDDSLDKDFYNKERPKKSKKKLCEWHALWQWGSVADKNHRDHPWM